MHTTLEHPDTLNLNLIGLSNDLPDNVYVGQTANNKHFCYFYNGDDGVVCTRTEKDLYDFLGTIDFACTDNDLRIVQVSFEEARNIAKQKALPINSLMIVKDYNNIDVHYVK